MSRFLSNREVAELASADEGFHSPVPTQVISNGEFNPLPQSAEQKKVEARIKEIADTNGRKLGMDRRQFLMTTSGMAAAFLAMNEVFGNLYGVTAAEAAEPEMADERANALKSQFVLDDQLHFVRDDYKLDGLMGLTKYVVDNWKLPMDKYGPMDMNRFKFHNFVKEIYYDSDTTVGFLSGAPFDDPEKWFLSNDQIKDAADTVNTIAGTKRLLYHSIMTPGQKGWVEEVLDRALETLNPTAMKGYTIGDPDSHETMYPWRLDDEKLMYPIYEKMLKAGKNTLAVHKGLLSADYAKVMPNAWAFATVDDVPKAAKDWPQMNFVIYHAAQRMFLEDPAVELAAFEKSGYMPWVSDLAAIPEKHGVSNVYADTGSAFAVSAVAAPRFAAGFWGTLIKGLGADHVFWGTDSVWYGSPQWQIEAFRRLEIPEDMQKKMGFAPLGPADGQVKNQILGLNAARHYKVQLKSASLDPWLNDGLAKQKQAYLETRPERSNTGYGYIVKPA